METEKIEIAQNKWGLLIVSEKINKPLCEEFLGDPQLKDNLFFVLKTLGLSNYEFLLKINTLVVNTVIESLDKKNREKLKALENCFLCIDVTSRELKSYGFYYLVFAVKQLVPNFPKDLQLQLLKLRKISKNL